MIVGGTATTGSSKKARKSYLRMIQNVQLMGSVPKIARRESPIIGFSEEDARRLHHPHDDALVVSVHVGDYNVHRMLVDNGSSTDILSSKKARKIYLRMIQNVQLMGSVPKIARRESPIIGFSEEDARRLHHPHDDALVVSVHVGDYNVHRMLVDNGSSADILYYPAFQQMWIDRARLIPTNAPLVGFGGTKVLPLGAITLSVTVGDYPQQITRNVTFLVVDCSSTYNGILG